MATAAPFVKLLRQLSSAKDEYRSGALDITWDGAKATLFFVFGQPNHALYTDDEGADLAGQEAVNALLHNLPRKFTVAPWRKGVVREESLQITVDELMEPFAQLAGAGDAEEIPDAPAKANDSLDIGKGFAADFDFSVNDFPLLPMGEPLWSDAALNVVHLDLLIPKLPNALIVLTGAGLRAAAVTMSGQLIDAVWVDENERYAGEGAAMMLMAAREGTVSCYRLDSPKLAEALTLLWRCPARYRDINAAWLDPERFVHSLISESRDCVIRVNGATAAGVAFFLGGSFVGAYTTDARTPSEDLDVLRRMLDAPGVVTIQQRAGDRALGDAHPEDLYHVGTQSADLAAPTFAEGSAEFTDAAATPSQITDADGDAVGAESPAALPAGYDDAGYDEVASSAHDAALAAGPASPAADDTPSWLRAHEDASTEPVGEAGDGGEASPDHWDPADAAGAFDAGAEPEGHPWQPHADADAGAETHAGADVGTDAEAAGTPSSLSWDADDAELSHEEALGDDGADIAADFFGGPTATDEPIAAEWAAGGIPDAGLHGTPEEPANPFASNPAEDPAGGNAFAAWDAGAIPDTDARPGTDEAAVTDLAGYQAPAGGDAGHAFMLDLAGNGNGSAHPGDQGAVVAEGSDPDPGEDDEDDGYSSPRLDLDFEGIKKDLIQIGVLWLGSDDVAPVADLIQNTRPSVDDFVATIDAIKGISVTGHDPSVIRAMAREMHYHAAEYLSGA